VGWLAASASVGAAGCGHDFPSANTFGRHYQQLTKQQKQQIFAELERQTKARTGVTVKISDPAPLAGVVFGFAISLTRCNGNRRCVEACVRENNPSRQPPIQYIRVLELEQGSFDLGRADAHYDHPQVPAPGKFYLPVQCHQCANPPCTKACPVGATWAEPDGLVVVDYDWCIGCRYCQAACPYFARYFNFAPPSLPPDEINPDQGYLSNRLRPVGVVEKCTFCLHRTRVGKFPACVEACPTGARKFGDLNDPKSEIRRILNSQRIYVLKEDLGTVPRLFYYFD